MSLLNFASTYYEVSDRLTLPESTSGPYVELVFTKDGHIITHGTDYTQTFSTGKRGLVPGSTGSQTEFLRGNGQWLSVSTTDLPIAVSIPDAIINRVTNTTILTTQQVIDYVTENMAPSDAMRYKGTISYANGVYTTHTVDGQDQEGFPTKCSVGDTYRVTSNGTYGGQVCSNGDLITCIKDGSGSSLNTAEYWTAIEANINGTTTHKINNTGYTVYTSNPSSAFTIYAPITGGTSGQILKSNGSTTAPTWVNQSTIVAGDIAESVKQGLLTSVSLGTTGVISVTVGGTTKTSSAASGTWGINITGQANRVANALSTGAGLTMGVTSTTPNTYNGSTARIINLIPATSTTIGGIIVDKDSENKTISVTNEGSIFLTQQNIINALGYTPGSSVDNKIYTTIISNSASSTTAVSQATINPYINLIQTQGSSKTVAGTLNFSGGGHTSVSGNGTKVTITSSWRDITIGGTSIENKKLNFLPTGDIYVKADSNGDDIQDLSFGLSWYNLSSGKYEIA